MACGMVALALSAAPVNGELTAYFTLDNVEAAADSDSGLRNRGFLGDASDLTISTLGGAPAPVAATGFIGGDGPGTGAVYFDGTSAGLGTFGEDSDAADVLDGYSYTMSLWMKAPSPSSGTTMGITGAASFNRYFGLGNSDGKATINRRNTTAFGTASPVGHPDEWQHVVAVYLDETNALLYVNGKLVVTQTNSVNSVAPSLLSIGNQYRTDHGSLEAISAYTGAIDDAGFFDTALTAADAALINGLGQTGRLGLDWLDEAKTLNDSVLATTALIDGVEWKRVTGLIGDIGDYGGTVAGNNAYIITGPGGNGIAVPEPALAGAVFGLGVILLRRTRVRG